ncbi:hypothetical protein ACFL35_14030 [Candidatus Riflebacteria bacterium]
MKRLSFLLFWCMSCSNFLVAQQSDTDRVLAIIKQDPAFNRVVLEKCRKEDKGYSLRLGKKGIRAYVFKSDDTQQHYDLAFAASNFSFKNLYKADIAGFLGDLALKNIVLLRSRATQETPLVNLPATLIKQIKRYTADNNLVLKNGFNFFAEADIGKSGLFGKWKKNLGIAGNIAQIQGQVGSDVFRILTTGRSVAQQPAVSPGIQQQAARKNLTLKLKLGGLNPSALKGQVWTGPLEITFLSKPEGIKASGKTSISFRLKDETLKFTTGVALNRFPGPKEPYWDFAGNLVGKFPQLFMLKQLRLIGLGLRAKFFKDGNAAKLKPDLSLSGRVMVKNKSLGFRTTVDMSRGVKPFLSTSLAGRLTLGELLGKGQDIPVLNKLALTGIQMDSISLSATAEIRGKSGRLTLFRPFADQPPFVAFRLADFNCAELLPNMGLDMLERANFLGSVAIFCPKKAGATVSLPDTKLPDSVKEALRLSLNKPAPEPLALTLTPGLSLFTLLDLGETGELQDLLDESGAGAERLPLRGKLDASVLQKAKKMLPKDRKSLLNNINLEAALPPIKIKKLSNIFSFSDCRLLIRSRKTGPKPELHFEIASKIQATIKNKKLDLDGALKYFRDRKTRAYTLQASGLAKTIWKKPFGIEWLTFNDIGLVASITKDIRLQKHVTLGLLTGATLGKQKVNLMGEITLVAGKVKDFALKVPGKVMLAQLPKIGNIPGIKEFSFADLEFSPRVIAGTLTWEKKNISASSVILLDPKDKNAITLLYRLKNFSLGKLIPKIEHTIIGKLEIPEYVVGCSTSGIDNETLGDFPEAVQRILAGIIDNPEYRFALPDGLSLLATLDPSKLSGKMKEGMDKLGIKDPIVLAGAIGGAFGGPPSVQLYGKLPMVPMPKSLPKCFKFAKGVEGSLFMKVTGTGDVQVGFSAGMNVAFKKDEPIHFATEFSMQASPVGVGVGVSGKMNGLWSNPLGLYGLDISDTLLKMTLEADSSVGAVIAGTTNIKGKRYKLQTLANLNVAASGFPKELVFNLEMEQISLKTYFVISDILSETIIRNPFVQKNMLDKIKDAKKKKAAEEVIRYFVRQLAAPTAPGVGVLLMLYDKFEVEKFPQLYFKDVRLYLATPGASDPDLKIDGMGTALKGKLFFLDKILGEVDASLNLTGMKCFGSCYLKNLGPLKIKDATVDIAANFSEEPRFIIRSVTDFLGWERTIDIGITKENVHFYFEDDLKELWHFTFDARSVGKSLKKIEDFKVNGSFASDFYSWLEKRVGKGVKDGFVKGNKELAKAKNALNETLDKVKKLNSDIRAAKRRARARIAKLQRPITNAENKVRGLSDEIGRTRRKKDRLKKWDPRRGGYLTKIKTLEASRATALFTLDKLKKATKIVPVEAQPDVAGLIVAQKAAELSLKAARAAVKTAEKINKNAEKIADGMIKGITKNKVLVTRKADFAASFKGLLKGNPAKLDLDLLIFNKPVRFKENFSFKTPKDINVGRIVKEVINGIKKRK